MRFSACRRVSRSRLCASRRLTAGLVGLIGMYFLLRHLGANRRIAMFGTAVFAFNPFYLCLSYSFMTDVPFLSLMILAMLFLLRGVDLGHRR